MKICLAAAPTMPFAVSTPTTIDTDGSQCASVVSGGANYCVIAATDITIDALFRATGKRPLVLIANESIVTTGLISVGSFRGSDQVGAGGDPSACAAGTPPAAGGGGAGGSFLGLGGSGGFGGNGASGGEPGAAVTDVFELRGGCPGQNGGHGGGAVYLIAGERIDVHGGINAAGAGAYGSSGGSFGGYGGGAGGMIGFEAPKITCNSLLLASGGGGGGGSQGAFPGGDGESPSTTTAARGGDGASGGVGGNGSTPSIAARGMAGAPGNTNAGGGGGGGGGAGLIKAPATANLGTMVSPPPTP